MRTFFSATALTTALAAMPATAQDLTHKAPPQDHPIAITHATVHTVSGDTFDNGFVLFSDGIIVEVGAGDRAFIATTEVIDAGGAHVYPGIIAPRTQLGLNEIPAMRQTLDVNEFGRMTPEVRAAVALNPDSTVIPVTRSAGVLAAGVFPTGGSVPGRVSVIQLEGWTNEDMTVRGDAGLAVTWPPKRPVPPAFSLGPPAAETRSYEQIAHEIDELFRQAAAYDAARDAGEIEQRDLRLEAMRDLFPNGDLPARAPVFLVAGERDQITSAVTWATNLGLRPVIVGGRDAPACAELLRRHDVPVIVGGVIGDAAYPKRADLPYDDAYTLPARLRAAGVRWCLALGDDSAHTRSLPGCAGLAVAYGLDHDNALRGITLSTAEILGVDNRLGSLDPGKNATLILADGDILEATTTVTRAFVSGRDIDLSNKQTKLAEKYREKYRQIDSE